MKSFKETIIKMESLDIAKEICFYFDAKIIGSMLFVQEKLLDYEHINDIDIGIDKDYIEKAQHMLTSQGYVETKVPYKQKTYEDFPGFKVFEKDNCKAVHLMLWNDKTNKKVHTIPELIKAKLERGYGRDINQVYLVICKMHNPVLKKKEGAAAPST